MKSLSRKSEKLLQIFIRIKFKRHSRFSTQDLTFKLNLNIDVLKTENFAISDDPKCKWAFGNVFSSDKFREPFADNQIPILDEDPAFFVSQSDLLCSMEDYCERCLMGKWAEDDFRYRFSSNLIFQPQDATISIDNFRLPLLRSARRLNFNSADLLQVPRDGETLLSLNKFLTLQFCLQFSEATLDK